MTLFRAFGGQTRAVMTNFLTPSLSPPKAATGVRLTKTHALEDLVSDRCKSDDLGLQEALGLFTKCLMNRPKSVSNFDQLLGAISMRMKHYSTVLSLAKVMSYFRIQPNIVTLSIVTDCYCHLGRVDLGFSVFGNILKLGFVPTLDTLSSLFRGLFLDAYVERLQEQETRRALLVKTLTTAAPDLPKRWTKEADNILAMASQMGQLQDPLLFANTCFFHALFEVSPPSDSEEDDPIEALCNTGFLVDPAAAISPVACTAFFRALCKHGMLAQARHLSLILVSKGIMSETQTNQLPEITCELAPPAFYGLTTTAQQHAVDPLSDDDDHHHHHHNTMLASPNTVEDLLRLMQRNGLPADIEIHRVVIDLMCKSGRARGAIDLFSSLPPAGLQPYIAMYGSTAVALLHKGMWDEATALLHHMKHNQLIPDDSTINALLQGCLVHYKHINGIMRLLFWFYSYILDDFTPDEKTRSLASEEFTSKLNHILVTHFPPEYLLSDDD